MADPDFEARLSRLFADPPSLPANEEFVSGVTRRLDRGWAWRSIGIAVAGGVAGVIGFAQVISNRVFTDAQVVSHESARVLSGYNNAVGRAGELLSLTSGGEVMWMAAGLAILALAFGVTRMVNDM